MNIVSASEEGYPEFAEVDPTGRYGRYNEILGKGSSKTVYRAFDEYQGIEVAWNQVKLHDFLKRPEDLERLYCEIHLLKTLKHKTIMKFYTSWVDTSNRNINFVTEMFTSGTLRQYRLKHRRVNLRAVKHWCRQILKGLLYLHSLNPPVIHRDLKCDNIFINGNQGEVKIGDLGLAAILRKSHADHCVGTPEFMAPEVYEEEYNELVDIYAFGMCVLEMVTFEYPYSECTHAAQIYKKVISGKKPEALYKVEDPEVRGFVEKCLASMPHRLNARELLEDPFLRIDDSIEYETELDETSPFLTQPYFGSHHNIESMVSGHDPLDNLDCKPTEFEVFDSQDYENFEDFDITIQGRRREDNGIFLRLRIGDKEGRIRNIYFPFDMENDTALSVATEMVTELDLTDQDVTKIADMIDGEISILVPEWKKGFDFEEKNSTNFMCHSCASNGSQSPLRDYVANNNNNISDISGPTNLQVLQCSRHGCAAVHGRFEEITYRDLCQTNGTNYTDIWAQMDGPDRSSPESSRDIYCDEAKEERIITMDSQSELNEGRFRHCHSRSASLDERGNVIRQEIRWLKAKYELQLRELRDQNIKSDQKSPCLSPSLSFKHFGLDFENKFSNLEAIEGSHSPQEGIFTAKNFNSRDFIPLPLHRANSLPVGAIDF